jgi:hypothetical protein
MLILGECAIQIVHNVFVGFNDLRHNVIESSKKKSSSEEFDLEAIDRHKLISIYFEDIWAISPIEVVFIFAAKNEPPFSIFILSKLKCQISSE